VTRRVVLAPAAREDLNRWRRTNPTRANRVRRMLELVYRVFDNRIEVVAARYRYGE